jgi:hypothetical protein
MPFRSKEEKRRVEPQVDADTASSDVVHNISDWYDGPRAGATEFTGRPYWYRSIYLDTSEWDPKEDRFELTPLTNDALSWEMETKRIFERWDSARADGSIVWIDGDEANFGALPEDMAKYRDLNEKLATYLSSTKPQFLVHGRFDSGSNAVHWKLIHKVADE